MSLPNTSAYQKMNDSCSQTLTGLNGENVFIILIVHDCRHVTIRSDSSVVVVQNVRNITLHVFLTAKVVINRILSVHQGNNIVFK